MELPELPPIDSKDSLPYSAIRYVSGYPESFVQEYAKRYAEQCILMERERCAKACEGQFAKGNPTVDEWDAGLNTGVLSCIAAIRSTSEPA